MDQDNLPTYLGTTVIGVDADGGVSNDVPVWLREFISRALSVSGIRTKRKVASDEAIESLARVDFDSLKDKDCPICYDAYQRPLHPTTVSASSKHVNTEAQPQSSTITPEFQALLQDDKALNEVFHDHYNIHHVEPMQDSLKFNDPSLFLPVDEGAVRYFRFPVRNLLSTQAITDDDMFPGFLDEDKIKQEKKKKLQEFKMEGHIPVKMPSCNHIFGKTCIVEWLKANVSCPLCRSEVEALAEEGPQSKRLREIQGNTSHTFNSAQDSVQQVLLHSTDVFNPFRRPFNPMVTPLTDSYMLQDWATPYDRNYDRVGVRDPSLILPRRFPFPDPGLLGRGRSGLIARSDRDRSRRQTSNTTSNNTTTTNNNDQSTNIPIVNVANVNVSDTSSDNASETSRNNSQDEDPMQLFEHQINSPFILDIAMNDNEEIGGVSGSTSNQFSPQELRNRSRTNSSEFHVRAVNRLGGPDRNRRSSPRGRTHPYSRPPSEENS